MYTNTYICLYYIYIFTQTISKRFLTTSFSSSDVIKNLKRLTNLKICIFLWWKSFWVQFPNIDQQDLSPSILLAGVVLIH